MGRAACLSAFVWGELGIVSVVSKTGIFAIIFSTTAAWEGRNRLARVFLPACMSLPKSLLDFPQTCAIVLLYWYTSTIILFRQTRRDWRGAIIDIRIDKESSVPIREQIKEQIRGLIQSRQFKTGDQIPTIWTLSVDLAVNFNTVAQAYRELDNENVIVTERGRGTFVAQTPKPAEMRKIRKEKLHELIENLFEETKRLGYSLEEVQQALNEQMEQEG
mgnify:CR=1 FL=1